MNRHAAPPREQPGKLVSLILTIAVHLGLLLFLFFGIRWQSQPPAALEVALTSGPPALSAPVAAPQPAARPEPRPEPPPEPRPVPKVEPKPVLAPKPQPAPAPAVKPEIATKAPEKKPEPPKPEPTKPEPKKPEPPKPEAKKPDPVKPEPPKPEPRKPEPAKPEAKKPDVPKPAPKDDYLDQRLAQEAKRLEDARMDSLLKGEAARASAARAAAVAAAGAAAGSMDKYKQAIQQKVRGYLLRPPGLSGNPEAVFEVDQLPSGEVLNVRLKRSSGIPALDDAIERSIRRASPLPLPEQRDLFERTLELRFRPNEG